MTSSDEHYITAFNGFKALRLPYQVSEDREDHRSFSMCLLLPDAIDGLPALEHRVCSETGFMDAHLSSWESVEVAIIEVNEKDTTAAAATVDDGMAFALFEDCVIKKKEDFVADYPFMFLIKEDRTGTVLFMGHVLYPLDD
ncbi:PREDICTED: serpin-ZX-like [Fragaria vesca subsp. vesca]